MKLSNKQIAFLLVFSLFFSYYRFPSAAEQVKYYEASSAPYELYYSKNPQNVAYYNFLCSSAALGDQLPKLPNSTSYVPPVNSGGHPLNYRIWIDKGLVVYGKPSNVQNNRFKCGMVVHVPGGERVFTYGDGYFSEILSKHKCSVHGTSCPTKEGNSVRGEWQYLGYDVSNNRFSNINFIDDAYYTPFHGRKWIKEPWSRDNMSRTGLSEGISIYNDAVYYDNEFSPKVREWIDNTLKGWLPPDAPEDLQPSVPYITDLKDAFNASAVQYDGEVYKYLYVQSPPTIMRSGQGAMWHQRPINVWYQSLSIPKLETKINPPVECKITYDPYTGEVPENELDEIVYINVNVTGILHDEEAFTGTEDEKQVKKTIYYNRLDIASWNYKITVLGKDISVNNIAVENKQSNSQTYTFIGSSEDDLKKIPISNRQFKEGFTIAAEVQPRYENGKLGNKGNLLLYVQAGVKPQPEKKEEVKVLIPSLQIGNNIPETAFDNIPFTGLTDDTDMSLVTGKEVFINGMPVSYDLFFSGNYVFPRTTTPNGYFAYVEVLYHLDKDAILTEGVTPEIREEIENEASLEYKSVDVVYVYPTRPNAHFALSSNTWKENRIINVRNDSPSANIQLVMDRYPITEYRWYYGGDTTKLHYGTNTELEKQLQYSKSGTYSLTLEAKNILGQWSEPYTAEFTVLEDYAPNIECNLADDIITRNDTLSAWHYDICSTDGDRVSAARIELWYDADNNGSYETKLREWNGLGDNGICEKEDFPDYAPDKLGSYIYKIYADEEFVGVPGQDCLTGYITPGDKKTAYYEIKWYVDNYQPLSDIYINAPIQRPKVDVFIMLDKNLNDTKREKVLNERVNLENFLLGQNIIPKVSTWDMKTYTYSQDASINVNTGGYPSGTYFHTSNGYSGTLNKTSEWDNGSYVDYGSYRTTSESRYFSDSWTNCKRNWGTLVPRTESYSHNPAPGSISINSDGFVGSIPRTGDSCVEPYWYTEDKKANTWESGQTWVAYYGGTLTKSVSVWVPDIRWSANWWATYKGKIYKDVRQPYSDPYQGKGDSYKYILYISDNSISELPDFQMAKSKADTKIILAGSPVIKNQSAHDFYIETASKSAEEILGEAMNYITETSPAAEEICILQNEIFNLNFGEFDLEGDAITEHQLQYVHESDYFDNPTGQESGTLTAYNEDTGWTAAVLNKFNNVGKYRIYRRVKDLPSGSLGSQYSYYSGATEVNILVHRKPVADAVLDWTYNTAAGTCQTIWIDKSYDLDHTSMENKGIAERKIMFRRNGGEWQYYIPDTLTYGNYEVQYFVRDIEGVWSEPWLYSFTLNNSPQFTAQARAKEPVFTLLNIPASENIEAYNLWTRHPSAVRLEFNLPRTSGSSGSDASKTVNFQNGVTGTQNGQDITWFNQELQIPSTFRDGTTALTIISRDAGTGAATSKTFSVNVNTPIGIVPGIQNQTLIANQSIPVTASTSKYPSTTTVQMQYGTAYQSGSLSMTGTVSGSSKSWTVNYTIPNSVPDGNYTARFVSTNPSGKQEIRTCTYTVTHNRPPTASITGTSPSYLYEGDDLTINFTMNDPDLQPLVCDLRVTKGAAVIWTGTRTVAPSAGVYQAQNIFSVQDIGPGNYEIHLTVTDTYGSQANSAYSFSVSELSITGAVNHTADWEVNRQKYNNAALNAGRSVRPSDTYFPGERYILHAVTSVINPQSMVTADNISVTILGEGLDTSLNKTGNTTFDGELWDEAMMRWDNRAVDFLFEVIYSNGTVKTDTIRTYISDDSYWRIHRDF